MKVTKEELETSNRILRREIESLREKIALLEKVPRLEHSMLSTVFISLEKITDCVAHVLSDMKGLATSRR